MTGLRQTLCYLSSDCMYLPYCFFTKKVFIKKDQIFFLKTGKLRRKKKKIALTLEGMREGGVFLIPPPRFLGDKKRCYLTDCQKLPHNCSLINNTSFEPN